MMLQSSSWSNLKDSISHLKISHTYLEGTDRVSVPIRALIEKNIESGDSWIITVNNELSNSWLNSLDNLIIEFKREVKINLNLGLGKETLSAYFIEISIFFNEFFRRLRFDSITHDWEFASCEYLNFDDYNLSDYFKTSIQFFYRELNQKIIEVNLFLETIENYKIWKQTVKKSFSGNDKIEWKKQVNQLVDFYLKQIEEGFIETNRDNLKAFLINNFTHKNNPLSEYTIATYLDPNRKDEKLPKDHKKIDPSDFLE